MSIDVQRCRNKAPWSLTMKKQRKSTRSAARKPKRTHDQQRPADSGRRDFLRLARNGAIGLVAVGGIGFFFVQNVRSSIHEHDLSRVGNGTPTVVQIHDPQCSLCRALQSEARDALGQFDDDELNYVVANIRSNEGAEFAARYGVPHVTLLLFDRRGQLKATLRGQRQSEELAIAFRQLARR